MSKARRQPDIHEFAEVTFSFAHTATVPEVTFPEAADYLLPDLARSCWIYLFREAAREIVFAHELHVGADGLYREAPLAENQGRPPNRPLAHAGPCVRIHIANLGGGNQQLARYWIWATKARLPTSCLPEPLRHSSRAKGAGVHAFKRWADAREMVPVVFDEALEGGRQTKVLFPIWRQIEEMSDVLAAARRDFNMTEANPAYAKRLLLFAAVQAIRQQIAIDDCLDLLLLGAEEKALVARRQLILPAKKHTEDLGKAFNSPAWKALEADIEHGDDANAKIWMKQFLGDHAPPLETFQSTQADLDALASRHSEILAHALSERDLKTFKGSRKGIKAYWSAAKALIAGIERANPGKVARLAAAAFEQLHGVTIRPGAPNSGSAFHKDDIKNLKTKLTENKLLNVGMAVLELANAICAVSDAVEAARSKTSTSKEKAVKAANAIGALSSLSSALASNAKLYDRYVPDAYPKEIRDKLTQTLREWKIGNPKQWKGTLWGGKSREAAEVFLSKEEMALVSSAEKNLGTMGRFKFNVGYSDALKGGLGAISGFADVISGITGGMEAFDFADPKSLALNGGIILGGGLAIIAGICLAPGAAVAAGVAAVAAFVAAGSYLLNTLLADDHVTTWLKFCSWGKRRGEMSLFGSRPKWLDGEPGELYLSVDRQLKTLQDMVHGLNFECHRNTTGGFFNLKYTARVFFPGSIIRMGITADGPQGVKVLKPFSEVNEYDTTYHYPPLAGESQREVHFMYPGVRGVHVSLQIDERGDGTSLYPDEPAEKRFEFG